VSGGATLELDAAEWRSLEAAVAAPEVEYALTLPGGEAEAEVFFSDLGHDYVSVNAEYSS
jgi:glutamate N-acetyltransferase/amino-acid N-acetyltransferase